MMSSSMRRAPRVAVASVLCLAIATAAHAAPIAYTMKGVATGSLGAAAFSGATLVVTVIADTATVSPLAPGTRCNDPKQATFTISGVGTGSISTPISIADNTAWQLVAFVRGRCVESGPLWTNGRNPNLGSYNLATELAPLALEMPSAPPGITVETSKGMLVIDSVSALTFEANLKNDAAALDTGAAAL